MTFAARVSQDPSQPIGELIVAGGSLTPAAYTMFDNGFGSRFANIILAGDSTLGDAATGVAFNYNKTVVAFSKSSSYAFATNTGVAAYNWSSNGFGSKYADPASFPLTSGGVALGTAVAFSPLSSNQTITVGINNSSVTDERQRTWQWSTPSGFGAFYFNPSSPITNAVTSVAYSPTGDVIVFAAGNITPIHAYKWTYATGFGTKYSYPSGINVNQSGLAVTFSPDGAVIAIGTSAISSNPTIYVYPWSFASGFGAKYANPSPLPTGNVRGVAFSPAQDAIAVAHANSPYISVYAWDNSTGFGAKYSDPAELPTGVGRAVAFSDSGNYIAVGHDNSPYVSVYPWSSSTGFGAKFANPISLPSGARSLAWRGA